METDHRSYQETLEAELLEFTGEAYAGNPLTFAKVHTADGRFLEVVIETSMMPLPGESFRAFAHPSPFRPDHSERDVLANEPSAPWLENIEILPSRHAIAPRQAIAHAEVTKRPFIDEAEGKALVNFLALRGVEDAEYRQGAVQVAISQDSVITMRRGRISLAGSAPNDPRPVRAFLDYVRANGAGTCEAEGSERFKEIVWAHAHLIGVNLLNYAEPQGSHREDVLSIARITYMQMTQEPSPAAADRANLLAGASAPGPKPD